MPSRMYGQALASAFDGGFDFDTDDIRVMLVSAAYVPNQDTHRYLSDVTNEVTGTGYTAGGIALTGKTVTYDAATNTVILDASDATWANSTITARYAIVFNNKQATAATKPLLAYFDFGADTSSNAGNFVVQWGTGGIVRLDTPA